MLAKSQYFFFFFTLRANFWLAWKQLPGSQKLLTLEAWLHPTQGAECINFFTCSLCQAACRSPPHPDSLNHYLAWSWYQRQLERMSTYFRSLWQSDTFYYTHLVNRKKNTSEILGNRNCHYLIASLLKAKTT